MSYNVLTIPPFDRQLKRLVKKYTSLKDEFVQLVNLLENNPKQGSELANNCFKIRLSIASKGKGRSGGARVITHLQLIDNNVFLISIYDKSEKNTITEKEINELLSFII